MQCDAKLQQAVLCELRWDPRVEAADLGVEVEAGVVTLSGTSTSYTGRAAAQEAARRVRGARAVRNAIVVVVPEHEVRTDTAIADAARHTLAWDSGLPAEGLTVRVAGGVITLDGRVASGYQHDDAERAVRRLRGVRGVVNNLVVSPSPRDPEEIRRSIEAALTRRAGWPPRRLEIGVEDDAITLTGTVGSSAEYEAVTTAARYTDGVCRVTDHLEIDWRD